VFHPVLPASRASLPRLHVLGTCTPARVFRSAGARGPAEGRPRPGAPRVPGVPGCSRVTHTGAARPDPDSCCDALPFLARTGAFLSRRGTGTCRRSPHEPRVAETVMARKRALLRDRLALADPGLPASVSAMRAVLGAAASLAGPAVLGQSRTVLLVGGFTAVVPSLAFSELHPRNQLRTLALGVPLSLAALTVKAVLAPCPGRGVDRVPAADLRLRARPPVRREGAGPGRLRLHGLLPGGVQRGACGDAAAAGCGRPRGVRMRRGPVRPPGIPVGAPRSGPAAAHRRRATAGRVAGRGRDAARPARHLLDGRARRACAGDRAGRLVRGPHRRRTRPAAAGSVARADGRRPPSGRGPSRRRPPRRTSSHRPPEAPDTLHAPGSSSGGRVRPRSAAPDAVM